MGDWDARAKGTASALLDHCGGGGDEFARLELASHREPIPTRMGECRCSGCGCGCGCGCFVCTCAEVIVNIPGALPPADDRDGLLIGETSNGPRHNGHCQGHCPLQWLWFGSSNLLKRGSKLLGCELTAILHARSRVHRSAPAAGGRRATDDSRRVRQAVAEAIINLLAPAPLKVFSIAPPFPWDHAACCGPLLWAVGQKADRSLSRLTVLGLRWPGTTVPSQATLPGEALTCRPRSRWPRQLKPHWTTSGTCAPQPRRASTRSTDQAARSRSAFTAGETQQKGGACAELCCAARVVCVCAHTQTCAHTRLCVRAGAAVHARSGCVLHSYQ